MQVYAAPILFERNAYDVPVFTRVHDFMWSGETLSSSIADLAFSYMTLTGALSADFQCAVRALTLHGLSPSAHCVKAQPYSHSVYSAAMAMQNLGSPMQLGFPISNYTMSLALLERIDFWDTTEDAIGEDFHMFVKAYFKTNGQVAISTASAAL